MSSTALKSILVPLVLLLANNHVVGGDAGRSISTLPRVVLRTEAGQIVLELDSQRAPITACNFLRYVRDGHYDGGHFIRTVRPDNAASGPSVNLIQAAARDPKHRYLFDAYGPIQLERTRDTGLSHVAGAVSMVRESAADSATSGFFIVTSDSKSLDHGGDNKADRQGFAVFGRVLSGMEVVKFIQQQSTEPTSAADDPFSGNTWLDPPMQIVSATIDGRTAHCRSE